MVKGKMPGARPARQRSPVGHYVHTCLGGGMGVHVVTPGTNRLPPSPRDRNRVCLAQTRMSRHGLLTATPRPSVPSGARVHGGGRAGARVQRSCQTVLRDTVCPRLREVVCASPCRSDCVLLLVRRRPDLGMGDSSPAALRIGPGRFLGNEKTTSRWFRLCTLH